MNLLEAFGIQCILFAIFILYFYIKAWYFEEKFKISIKELLELGQGQTVPIVLFVWFIFITLLRYYTQMPMLGMYSWVL